MSKIIDFNEASKSLNKKSESEIESEERAERDKYQKAISFYMQDDIHLTDYKVTYYEKMPEHRDAYPGLWTDRICICADEIMSSSRTEFYIPVVAAEQIARMMLDLIEQHYVPNDEDE